MRYAGDLRLDVVNLSLFADPYLYYCGNDAEQRALYSDLRAAARYAQQRGVVIVAAAGNESSDLQHPDPGAVIAAVERSAQPRSCPAADGFMTAVPCQGQGGRTSYFGHGLVDALAAART